jgi:hypothetical protein
MKKSLQNQYTLIKEGKGQKDIFLKEAKSMFPNFIPHTVDFNQAVNLLKDKNIISENIVSVGSINHNVVSKEDFELDFERFLKEAKEQEDSEKVKAEEKNPIDSPNIHDNSDNKNIDNVIFDQLMAGYYIEMKKEKNCDKTVQEIKDIVLKNLQKDPIFYVTKGQFGLEDIGYEVELPGLGTPKEPKGPHKSSGYGNLNENKGVTEGYSSVIDSNDMSMDDAYYYLKDMGIEEPQLSMMISNIFNEDGTKKSKMNIQEQKLRKIIRNLIKEELTKSPLTENLDKRLKEIEGESQLEALQSKVTKLEEEIEKRNAQLGMLDENEDLSELLDKNAVKKIQKEIKLLEKVKDKYTKMCEKMGNKGVKKEVIDENEDDEFAQAEEMYNLEFQKNGTADIEAIASKFPGMEEEIINHLEGYTIDTDSEY